MPAIAVVSREVFPFGGGGIGVHVTSLAEILASEAEVTIFTSSHHRESYERLIAAGDPRIPTSASFRFIDEPDPLNIGSYYNYMHAWSARTCDALRKAYRGTRGPDLVEFPDYLSEGLVTVQARDSLDPAFRNTLVCVRTHTSAEMCSVLNGVLRDDFETRSVFASERYALERADRLIWPGGDVLRTYERFYERSLARPVRIANGFLPEVRAAGTSQLPSDGPLRFIYFGRLERRKGVQNLLRAVTAMHPQDWELTVVGDDTDTAPLGVSMKMQLEAMAGGDPRISFLGGVSRQELPRLIAEHHLAVLPSLWECWPNTALETLAAGRPLVATPTGGFVEIVQSGESGWLTEDCSGGALTQRLYDLFHARGEVDALIESGRPRRQLAKLVEPDRVREGYLRLLGERARGPQRRRESPPLVSVVLTYFQLEEYVEDAIRSVFAQTHRPVELILVNDGSMREADLVLADLAARYPLVVITQPNSGLGAARNFGISQACGELIVPLDADNILEPEFIARGVELLDAHEEYAYVTSWSRYIDSDGTPHEPPSEGYQPLGNRSEIVHGDNVAGDATAVIRRRVFDLGHWYSQDMTSYEDWLFYRELHSAGIYGAVIPERLFRYRVRPGSMIREIGLQHQGRLADEMRARIRERQVTWESKNA